MNDDEQMGMEVMSYLDEVEARLKAATPGPWALDVPLNPNDISLWAPDGALFLANMVEVSASDGIKYSPAFDIRRVKDAEFIAHARTDIPELLSRLRGAIEVIKVMGANSRFSVEDTIKYLESNIKYSK